MENLENKQEINQQINDLIMEMAKDPKNADNYHKLSRLYLQLEDYDKVMSVLESLLTIYPTDVQALVGMGTMWFYEKDFRKSLSYYNKALEINPKNYLIYYNIGNVFAEWKNFPKALFYYNRAIDLNATNPEIYNAIALLYQDNEEYIESKAYYEKALSLDPENITALVEWEMFVSKYLIMKQLLICIREYLPLILITKLLQSV